MPRGKDTNYFLLAYKMLTTDLQKVSSIVKTVCSAIYKTLYSKDIMTHGKNLGERRAKRMEMYCEKQKNMVAIINKMFNSKCTKLIFFSVESYVVGMS